MDRLAECFTCFDGLDRDSSEVNIRPLVEASSGGLRAGPPYFDVVINWSVAYAVMRSEKPDRKMNARSQVDG